MATYQYSKEGIFIKEWKYMTYASISLGLNPDYINSYFKRDKNIKYLNGYFFSSVKHDGLTANQIKGALFGTSKILEIHQYSLDGEFIKKFHSANKLSKEIKVSKKVITAALNNTAFPKYIKEHLYSYSYLDKKYIQELNIKYPLIHPVYQYDLDGNNIKIWESGTKASKALGMDGSSMNRALRNKNHPKYVRGFLWSHEYYTQSQLHENYFNKPKGEFWGMKYIYQYYGGGKFFKKYLCMAEVIKATNLKETVINKAVKNNGKSNFAGGFLWSLNLLTEDQWQYGKEVTPSNSKKIVKYIL